MSPSVRMQPLAGGRDDLRRQYVVDREAMPTHEEAGAAGRRDAADADEPASPKGVANPVAPAAAV